MVETDQPIVPRLPRVAWVLALIVAFAFPLLFPGQTPFVNDEPGLITMALDLNAQGQIAHYGYAGSQGRRYGPLVLWVFQLILSVTHDPIAVMTIYIAILSATLVGGLAWIQRATGLWRWGLLAIAMSPYAWFYRRMLWDNVFNIGLGTLALAAYASFLARPRSWILALSLYLAGLMLLVHLMAAPLIAAIGTHLLIFRWNEARSRLIFIAIAGIAVFATGWVYWPYLLSGDVDRANLSSTFNGWWFALLGPRVLSAAWIEYLFPTPWLRGDRTWYTLLTACRVVALLAFPITWLGLCLGAAALVRRRERSESVTIELARVGAITVLAQLLLNGVTHTYGHPHYYNGTWAALVVLAWIGIDRITRLTLGRVVAWVQIVAVAGATTLLLARVVRTGGTRQMHFGTTLAEQVRVVRDMSHYAPGGPIEVQAAIYPHALQTILRLSPPQRTGVGPAASLVVRYTSTDPNDAHVELAPASADEVPH